MWITNKFSTVAFGVMGKYNDCMYEEDLLEYRRKVIKLIHKRFPHLSNGDLARIMSKGITKEGVRLLLK